MFLLFPNRFLGEHQCMFFYKSAIIDGEKLASKTNLDSFTLATCTNINTNSLFSAHIEMDIT